MFWGKFVLIVNDVLTSEYYFDVIFNIFCVIGYLFIVVFGTKESLFCLWICCDGKKKIKKFEKIKYLTLMIILLLGEIIYIGSVMYDFN